jgi:hypothetical protein
MNIKWNAGLKAPIYLKQAQFEDQTRRMSLARRWDGVLFLALLALFLFVIAVLILWVRIGLWGGWFEAPLIAPLADERILTNIRNPDGSQRFLSATAYAAEGRVVVAQHGGGVHFYDPRTGLWATEYPFQDGSLENQNLVALRSGCGSDPFSDHVSDCPEDQSLWALTEKGGLARRLNGRWEVLVGDTAFIGARNLPVETAALTSAAISADQQWLLIGTQEDGLGIYELSKHRWFKLDSSFYALFASAHIQRIVWHNAAFWVGTDAGVYEVRAAGNGFTARPGLNVALNVLDLEVSPDQTLWALGTLPCENVLQERCTWLGKIKGVKEVDVLLNERNRFSEVALSNLIFAQLWGERVVMAGQAGIISYHPATHAWERIYNQAVDLVLDQPDHKGFVFAAEKRVGIVRLDGSLQITDLPEGPVDQLIYGDGNQILALIRSGNVYTLTPGSSSAALLFEGQDTQLDPGEFRQAIAFGDALLLVGQNGVLIHDVRSRSYQDIQASDLPAWLVAPDTQFITSGDYTYGLTAQNQVYILPLARITQLDFYMRGDVTRVPVIPLPSKPASWWKWGDLGTAILLESGQIIQIGPTGAKNELTGSSAPDLSGSPIHDVAALPTAFVLAQSNLMSFYSPENRRWTGQEKLPDGNRVLELAASDGKLWVVSDQGNLISVASGSVQYTIGGANRLHVSDDSLSDVLELAGTLYLGGNGWVEVYDPTRRAVTAQYHLKTDAPVKILAGGARPLAWSAGKAFWGEEVIDPAAGEMEGVSSDGSRLWSIRKNGETRYLKSYELQNPTGGASQCFFRTPVVPGIEQVYDARKLPGGAIVLSTNNGIWIYNTTARSWVRAAGALAGQEQRLYLTSKYLIVVGKESKVMEPVYISTIPLTSIVLPHSCSQDPAGWSVSSWTARAVSVNEAQNQMVWVDPDQKVNVWLDGQSSMALSSPGEGPAEKGLLRFYNRGNRWEFITQSSIWSYDVAAHIWSEARFSPAPSAELADANLEWPDGSGWVTVRDAAGRFYTGKYVPGSNVNLSLLYQASTVGGGALNPENLLDVQSYDSLWSFVSGDRIDFYNPASHSWVNRIEFKQNDPSRQFGQVIGIDVSTTDHVKTWWIDQIDGTGSKFIPYQPQPAETTALDRARNIWRYRSDGTLLKCSVKNDEFYDCQVASPPHFLVQPDRVSLAFHWNDRIWILSDGGLRVYDPRTHTEIFSNEENKIIEGVQQVRQFENELFLVKNSELWVVHPTGAGSNLSLSPFEAGELRIDSAQKLWGKFKDGWKIYQQGAFQLPENYPPTLFLLEGGSPTGLDSENHPVNWQAGKFTAGQAAFPPEIGAQTVLGLFPGDANRWWVLEKDRVSLWEPSLCDQSTCYTVSASAPLPAEMILGDRADISGVTSGSGAEINIFRRSGKVANIRLAGAKNITISVKEGAFKPFGTVDHEWPAISAQVRAFPDGSQVLDPVERIGVASNGALQAVWPSGAQNLADKGEIIGSTLTSFPVLKAGWLNWDRTKQEFQVVTPQGQVNISKRDFIQDGSLPFESMDAVLSLEPGRYWAANRRGIWLYSLVGLPANDPLLQFQPVSLQGKIDAAHGQVLAENGAWTPGQPNLAPPQTIMNTIIDDVVIQENLRKPAVTVVLKLGQSSFNAWDGKMLVWDKNRRGIAHSSGNVLVQNDAGLFSLNEFHLYESPNHPYLRDAKIVSESGKAFAWGKDWAEWTGNGWRTVADPTQTRLPVDDSLWTWTLQNNALHVILKTGAFRFGQVSGQRLGFTSDQLKTAGALVGQLVVETDAFLEYASPPDGIGLFAAPRLAPVDTDNFEQVRTSQGNTLLFNYRGSSASQWDPVVQKFVSSADPRLNWKLAETADLRFTRQGKQVEKEVTLENLASVKRWAPFNFWQGSFPFDRVTTAATFGNELYVGTRAGFQILSASGSVGLSTIRRVEMNPIAGKAPAGILQIGTPLSAPAKFMILTEDGCWERNGGAAFQFCQNPAELDHLLRVQTPFWLWEKARGGDTTGQYLHASGTLIAAPIQLAGRGFAHDQIRAGATCDRQVFTLWTNGWVTVFPQLSIALTGQPQNYSDLPLNARGFLCLERPLEEEGVKVKAGLYLVGQDGTGVAQYQNGGWQVVAGAVESRLLLNRFQNPPVYDGGQLRLTASQQGELRFEYKSNGQKWIALKWENGRLAIDRWQQLLLSGKTLWAATPEGLVSFQVGANRKAMLDPATVRIVREPIEKERSCTVSDLEEREGQTWLRCQADSAQVFAGQLTPASDQANFVLQVGQDPFAARSMISTLASGFWAWDLKNRVNGKPGNLEVWLDRKDALHEKAVLANGQWTFDALESLAFEETKWVELATPGSGWLRSPLQDLHLKGWTRPTEWPDLDAQAVTWVGHGYRQEQGFLCLRRSDGKYARVVKGKLEQNIQSCSEYQAQSGLWQYEINETKLEITGSDLAPQPIQRDLSAGRFQDDIVNGLPLTGKNGKGLFYLLPTQAGALRFDQSIQAVELTPIQGQELHAIYLFENQETYFANGSLFPLSSVKKAVLLTFDVPAEQKITAIGEGPWSFLRVDYLGVDGPGWYFVDRVTGLIQAENALEVNIENWEVYQDNRAGWPGARWLQFQMYPDQAVVMKLPEYWQVATALESNFRRIMSIPVGEKVILVGAQDIQVVNLSRAVRQMMH